MWPEPGAIKWAAADPFYSLYDASHPSQQGHLFLQEYYFPYILENKNLVTLKRCFEYEKVLWSGKVGHFVGNGGREGNRFDRDHH